VGNDPAANTAGNICSVATFPTTPLPWFSANSNVCGDYKKAGNTVNRVDEIKVVCQGDATGNLRVPYTLTYQQNTGGATCTGPADVKNDSPSKCNKGVATVSGDIKVFAGAWLDVTKQTRPGGQSQPFTFTATGPAGSKVIALTGATLSPTSTSGGTYHPATIDLASNSTSFTLQDGQTARVFINALGSAQTLTVVETAETGWDPTVSINCVATAGAPPLSSNNATRTMSADLSASNYAAACTITNTKRPTLTVSKTSLGDVGTFTFTGSNGWASQNISTATAGVPVAGTTQILTQNVATTLSETAVAGYRLAALSCSGLGAGGNASYDLVTRTVDLDAAAMAPGADVVCSFINQRQRTLSVSKSVTPLTDPGLFVLNADGSSSAAGGHGNSVNRVVDVGSSVNVSEVAGPGTDLANYSSSYSCNTTPVLAGSGTTAGFTMPNADIDCIFSNIRRSASLTLAKGLAAGNYRRRRHCHQYGLHQRRQLRAVDQHRQQHYDGGGVTVYAGESGSISESFSSGNPLNYNATLGCSGSAGLSGSTLTVAPEDTAIVCTYTNARRSASLVLRKTWIDAIPGDTVTVSSTGFLNNASSGAAVSTGNNTVTGAPVTVYAAESGSISESFSVGDPAAYTATLSCTGSSGLSGSTLTVSPDDTAIVCTYSNETLKPQLTLLKLLAVMSDPLNGTSNPKSIPGAIVSYTLRVTNSGPGTVDNNTLIITDPLPAQVELYVGDLGGPGGGGPVVFVNGSPSSGLSWTYTSLASLTDLLDFSNNNGATWTYVPVPDGAGFDPAVNRIRLRPAGIMNAAGGGNPYVEFVFRVRVK